MGLEIRVNSIEEMCDLMCNNQIPKEAKKMKARFTYHVEYLLNGSYEEARSVDVIASSKTEAYDKAVYEIIPEKEGRHPYGAWVASVTYANGNHKEFRTFCGNPY